MTIFGGVLGMAVASQGSGPSPIGDTAKALVTDGVICSATEQINDAVYLYSANEVRQASASNIGAAKQVGFVISKQTITSCTVMFYGKLGGFSGLIPGAVYYLSETPGQITATPVTGDGKVLVKCGVAWDSLTLLVNGHQEYTVRR